MTLRTHIEKIINFSKVLALLNQRHRLHAKINDQEYVIVEPEDFLKALDIPRAHKCLIHLAEPTKGSGKE